MSPQKIWIAYLTILRTEVGRVFRIWKQTLLPPIITQSLYFLVFGAFIGSRVGLVDGVPYMAFIVPGLVMMTVIQNSFANVVGSFYGSKFSRSVEEMMVSPMPNWTMLAGFVSGGVVRGLLTGSLVIGVSTLFVQPTIAHPVVIFIFAILTSLVFALGGFLNALAAKSFDDTALFSTFILTPLTYLGGVFYSVTSLPEPWHTVSRFNPIVYMVDGFRHGFYGTGAFNPWVSAIIIFGVLVVLWTGIIQLLKRGYGLRQ